MAATAKRKKLEQELAEAQTAKEDKEYAHRVDSQKKALDKDYENYKKEKDQEIKRLEEYAKDTEKLFNDMVQTVTENNTLALQAFQDVSAQYGVTISDALTKPLEAGKNYIQQIKEEALAAQREIQAAMAQADQQASLTNYTTWRREDIQKTLDRINDANGKEGLSLKATLKKRESYKKGSSEWKDWNEKYKDLKALKKALEDELNAVKNTSYATLGINAAVNDAKNSYLQAKKNYQEKSRTKAYYKYWYEEAHRRYEKYVELFNQATLAGNKIEGFETEEKLKKKWARGIHNSKTNQIGWTQEKGQEAILSPSRGAVLTRLNKGDTVLNARDTEQLFQLAKMDMGDFLKNLVSMKVPTTLPSLTNQNTLNIENLVNIEGNASSEDVKKIKLAAEQAVTEAFTKLRNGLH